jgi:hypothetical protein
MLCAERASRVNGLRIALITGVYPPRIGGPASQTRHIALMLQEQGFDPFVVTLGGSRSERVEREGIRVYYLPLYYGNSLAKVRQYAEIGASLQRIMRREKPDILHMPSVGYLALVVSSLNRWFRIPSLIKCAGGMVWETLMSRACPDNLSPYEQVFQSSPKRACSREWRGSSLMGLRESEPHLDFRLSLS